MCTAFHVSEILDLFIEAALGDTEAQRVASVAQKWLAATASATQETAPPCLSCESVFYGSARPVALALILPAEGGGVAFTAGICRECDADNTELIPRGV
jgi:hypothetical protein